MDAFIKEFLKLNPSSQICIIGSDINHNEHISIMKRNQANSLFLRNLCNPMSSNWTSSHGIALKKILHKAVKKFKGCPLKGSREMLMITSYTKRCKYRYLPATLTRLQNSHIQVNIVGINEES